ncbi:MAG: ATP-binding protein, partial [Bryobacteraceae bacterium]
VQGTENIIERPDGERIWFAPYPALLRDAEGRITGGVNMLVDITKRKHAEAAREALSDQMAAELADMQWLQEISVRLIQEGDVDTLYRRILDAAAAVMHSDMASMQMLCAERGEIRLLASQGFHPSSAAFWEWVGADSGTSCGEALQTGRRVIVPDVETCDFMAGTADLDVYRESGIRAVQSTPLISRSGHALGMISTHWRKPHRSTECEFRLLDVLARQAADLIERAQAQTALSESEERFRALVNTMPNLAWMANADGWIFWFNERWHEYTGTMREEMEGAGWQKVHDPDVLPKVIERWNRSIATGEPFAMTFPIRGADGRFRSFLTRVLPLRNERGEVVRWFGTNTDITEHKEMQDALLRVNERLRRANFDLQQFAYSASHDLQEPLRNIAVYSEIVNRRYAGALDARGREFVGFITAGARRLELLIKDLLAYTQFASAPEESSEPTDAAEALTGALSSLSEAIRETGAEITCDPLPKVRVREIELRQLLQNLIGNAIKYRRAAEAPRIHISVEREPGMWRISVCDNGIGIAPEYRETVFGMFKRLHTEDEYPGTGIGLAICRKIVERHGGRIRMESEAGRGSRFVFTLPD